MESKRFLIVPVDSSAARIPRPGATIAVATLFNSVRFIAFSSTYSRRSFMGSTTPSRPAASCLPVIQGTFRRRLGDLDCTIVEWLMLEGAERAVPDQGLAARQH